MERSQKSLVTDDEPLSLFVSYAREDEAFVDELTAGLEARGYDVWRDLDDIPPAADWRDEIQDGIDRCEALVIVMSPASLASTEVAKEVEIAHAHGKRLVPVMSRAVDPREAPPAVAAQNWISWTGADQADLALEKIDTAMKIDPAWSKEHTTLNGLALAWERQGRDRHRLLRGTPLDHAEAAIVQDRPLGQPQVTALMREFVGESRRVATRRQRRAIAVTLVVAIGAVALALVAVISRFEEARQREEAERQRDRAVSAALAARSESRLAQEPDLAALLALESLRTAPTVDARGALLNVVDTATTFVQRVDAHEAPISTLTRSGSVPRAASGDIAGGVVVWDVTDAGVEKASDFDVGGAVRSLAIDESGTRLTVIPSPHPAQRWDIAAAQPELVEEGQVDYYESLSQDGRSAAGVASLDGDAVLVVGDPFAALEDLQFDLGVPIDQVVDEATLPVFSADGSMVAFGVGSEIAVALREEEVWVPFDLTELSGLETVDGLSVESLAFVGNDGLLAVGITEGHIYLIDVFGDGVASALQPLTTSAPNQLSSITVREQGQRLELIASVHDNGEVKVWVVEDGVGEEFETLRGHTEEALAVALSEAGVVMSADWDGDLIVSDAFGVAQIGSALTSENDESVHLSDVIDVAFVDDATVVSSEGLGGLVWWDVATLRPVENVDTSAVVSVAARDGHVVTGDDAGNVEIISPDGGRELSAHTGSVDVVAVSPDTARIVTAAGPADARVWAIDGSPISEVELADDVVLRTAVFSDSGDLWIGGAQGDEESAARVWRVDPATGEVVDATQHNDEGGHVVTALALSPDGSTLASGGSDRRVFLHDLDDLDAEPRELAAHVDVVSGAVFVDDDLLVTSDFDGRVLVWDVPSARVLGELTGPADGVTSLAIDPSGERLVAGSEDDFVWSWDLRLDTWIDGACQVAGRNMTDDEWNALLLDESPVAHCPDAATSAWPPADYSEE